MESRLRSIAKSITWRLLGIASLGAVLWIFTGNIEQTTIVTLAFNGSQLVFYYIHERVWDNSSWGR